MMFFTHNEMLGSIVGYISFGPFGAMYGKVIGKSIDNFFNSSQTLPRYLSKEVKNCRRNQTSNRNINAAFFDSLFSVMGLILKSCLLSRKNELRQLQLIMDHMKLSSELRLDAINQFYNGQSSSFVMNSSLIKLIKICGRRTNPIKIFVEILLQSVYKDGKYVNQGINKIKEISAFLNISTDEFEQTKSLVASYNEHLAKNKNSYKYELENAYNILGLEKGTNKSELRKKYKQLMNQHHPDKLTAKGFPKEFGVIATEKTQEIKNAYDLINKNLR